MQESGHGAKVELAYVPGNTLTVGQRPFRRTGETWRRYRPKSAHSLARNVAGDRNYSSLDLHALNSLLSVSHFLMAEDKFRARGKSWRAVTISSFQPPCFEFFVRRVTCSPSVMVKENFEKDTCVHAHKLFPLRSEQGNGDSR